MSLVPAFEIGLWNAWILMLYYPLHPLLMQLIDRLVGTGAIFSKMGDTPEDKNQPQSFTPGTVLTVILLLYSVFLPLRLGTAWFYAGVAIWGFGLVTLLIAIANAASTPPGEPFVKGMYRYSRHPMYLCMGLTWIGAGVAAASWLFLLLAAVLTVLFANYAVAEERGCLERFGERYRAYMNRTPRWVGRPGAVKAE